MNHTSWSPHEVVFSKNRIGECAMVGIPRCWLERQFYVRKSLMTSVDY
ncbi:hypothetical protein [Cerasicoccus frondis]|nr:hypothetical protein [Cerasicoccus frondis]